MRYVENYIEMNASCRFVTGYMLINWYLSEIPEESVSLQELKLLAIQFCTHLLAAGVLRQIPDKDAPLYNIFKVNLIFFYTQLKVLININCLFVAGFNVLLDA